jgi:hypothetical protein
MRRHAVRGLFLSNQPIIMQKRLLLLRMLSGSLIFLTGCAATVQPANESKNSSVQQTSIRVSNERSKNIVLSVTGSSISTTASDWPSLQQEWREALAGAATDANAALRMKVGEEWRMLGQTRLTDSPNVFRLRRRRHGPR